MYLSVQAMIAFTIYLASNKCTHNYDLRHLFASNLSKKEDKDQESIQSSTTPDLGYQ